MNANFNNLPEEGKQLEENNDSNSDSLNNVPVKEPPTKDELITIMKLKNKIIRYKTTFPHIFEKNFSYKFENLDNLSIQDLERLILELSIMVNTQSASGLTKTIYFESVRVAEIVSPYANIQIQGLYTALQQNQGVIDCLNELSLKYEDSTHIEPELRLFYMTLMSAIQIHKLNSSGNTINNFLKKQIPENKTDKYKDL